MAPKARDIDQARLQELLAAQTPQREIARLLDLPEATLRYNIKRLSPKVHQGPPGDNRTHETRLGRPQGDQNPPNDNHAQEARLGRPQGDQGPPPLYVHPGIPDDNQESPVGGEDIAEVHHGIPALPALGIPEGTQGLPSAALHPELVEVLTTAWPDLGEMLVWWRDRRQSAQEPPEKLERATYHVAPRWIEAVRREADLTGESYAAVVNRAFAQYFAGKST